MGFQSADVKIARIETARFFQRAPVRHAKVFSPRLDQPVAPQVLHHPVHVHAGKAEPVGQFHLGDRQVEAVVVGEAIRWCAVRRPTPVSHSRKIAASMRVSRQSRAAIPG